MRLPGLPGGESMRDWATRRAQEANRKAQLENARLIEVRRAGLRGDEAMNAVRVKRPNAKAARAHKANKAAKQARKRNR